MRSASSVIRCLARLILEGVFTRTEAGIRPDAQRYCSSIIL